MFKLINKKYLYLSLLVLLVAVTAAVFLQKYFQGEPVETENLESPINATEPALVLSKSLPVKLRIPELSIDSSFVAPLGLLPDGEVEVPDSYTEVGWYKFGPTPGELGPAVILGHVDSYQGPAVLFSLGQLEIGQKIFIDREDGTTAVFEVTELERPRQSAFPTAQVYGDIDHSGLRIITCSGIYVRGTQRYTHNLIVYAKLVSG